MSTPYIGEIRMFSFGTRGAPNGWQACDGSLLPISQYDALFALIGTTYGGDGQTTFGVPDLRGRVPMHQGTGPGLSTYVIGQKAGTETVTVLATQMPAHTHSITGPRGANNGDIGGTYLQTSLEAWESLTKTTTSVGSGIAHNNLQPTRYLWCLVKE